MFDMAMEMHELQKRATEVQNALRPLNTRMTELAKEIAGRNDLPADVKATFEAFNKDLTAFAPKFAPALGGRGGGGGGGSASGGRRRRARCAAGGQPADPDWPGQERPDGDDAA